MITSNFKTRALQAASVLTAASMVFGFASPALASSHREAPLIAGDPKADATDLFAFVSPDAPSMVTLIATYIPFEEPAGGPNFYPFGDKTVYEIKVDNDGDAREDISYQFQFKTITGNSNTFLYNTGVVNNLTDATLNVRQTYTLTKVVAGVPTVLGTDLPVGPSYVGAKSMPNYAALEKQAISNVAGIKAYAGQNDDPFFVDLGGVFNLLTVRKLPGNAGGGVDGLKGYNVNSLVLQIPITDLTKNHNKPTDVKDPAAVIGVWTTASRQSTRVLNNLGATTFSGDWVQVSRLGAPLVNELVVPLGYKDIWNGSKPVDDAQFANGVTDPEVGKLLNGLYGIKVPPQGAFGTANMRDDLVAIFLTGIPGLTQPANVKPSEELRLNVAVAPSANPNPMGVIGGDAQGYPNGRRLADDVTDISLRAVAGAAYPLFHPSFTPDATGIQLGDGVNSNDVPFRSSFPYLGMAQNGFDSTAHGSSAVATDRLNAAAMRLNAIADSVETALSAFFGPHDMFNTQVNLTSGDVDGVSNQLEKTSSRMEYLGGLITSVLAKFMHK